VSQSWKRPLDISLAWISFRFLASVPLSPYCLNGVSWHGELNFTIITWPKPPTPPWCPTKLLLARGWFNPNKKACHSPPLRDLHLHRCFDMLTCYGKSLFRHLSPNSSFGVTTSNFRFIVSSMFSLIIEGILRHLLCTFAWTLVMTLHPFGATLFGCHTPSSLRLPIIDYGEGLVFKLVLW